jgi:hypothetical protein
MQCGSDPRLAHDPLTGERDVGDLLVGDAHPLQRHLAAEQLVAGPPHSTHATGPDELTQPVAARDRLTVRGAGHHSHPLMRRHGE